MSHPLQNIADLFCFAFQKTGPDPAKKKEKKNIQ